MRTLGGVGAVVGVELEAEPLLNLTKLAIGQVVSGKHGRHDDVFSECEADRVDEGIGVDLRLHRRRRRRAGRSRRRGLMSG